MKLAFIGYGGMGKAIEKIAFNRKKIFLLKTKNIPIYKEIKNVEISIDFSQPKSAFTNLKICLEEHISVICGTTGWDLKIKNIKNFCLKNSGTFMYTSNFSIGVNLFFEFKKKLSKLFIPYKKEYEFRIEEIHHVNKLDAPSGTASTLAKLLAVPLAIKSKRFKNISGIHIVKYVSFIDKIICKHSAFSKAGFALGVIIAVEWINYKKGIFSIKEIS